MLQILLKPSEEQLREKICTVQWYGILYHCTVTYELPRWLRR